MAAITLDRIENEDFFSLVGLANISEEDKNEILESMAKTVHARVYAIIYRELDDADRTKLNECSSENLVQFLTDRGFNLEELLVEEAIKYKVELATVFELASTPAAQGAV